MKKLIAILFLLASVAVYSQGGRIVFKPYVDSADNSRLAKVDTSSMLAPYRNKLATIEVGATVNSTDAQLRDRSTHTGTQPGSTISDFQSLVSANSHVANAVLHYGRTDNPHVVTKAQVGLPNADNTSDANKPISTATQAALDGKVDENTAITPGTATKITYDAKGLVTAGASATTTDITEGSNQYFTQARARTSISLTTSGTNSAAEYNNSTGVFNIPQIDLSGLQAQLNGTGFVKASGTTISYDNISYTPTSRTLTIGANTFDLSANRTFALTKTDVGLPNVDNTSDANKPVSTATQTALDGKLNITDTAAMLLAYQTALNNRQESFYNDEPFNFVLAQGNATTFTVLGTIAGLTGTVTARASNGTNTFTRHQRFGMVSAAAINSSAGIRNNNHVVSINGGFRFSAVAGISSAFNASQNLFIGFTTGTPVIGATSAPSSITNMFGFGGSGGNTIMQFYYNDGSGTADSISLGAGFPLNTASVDLYYFEINAPGGGSSVSFKVTNKSTGATADATVSTNLPSSTSMLSWHMWINTGPNIATAVALDIVKAYCKPLDL